MEETRAIACAATFAQRVRHEAAFFHKVMELRGELHSANPQRALLLSLDCFGLVARRSRPKCSAICSAAAGLDLVNRLSKGSESHGRQSKKRLEVIQPKLQLLRQKLAGAKKQDDEPGEVRKLEAGDRRP